MWVQSMGLFKHGDLMGLKSPAQGTSVKPVLNEVSGPSGRTRYLLIQIDYRLNSIN